MGDSEDRPCTKVEVYKIEKPDGTFFWVIAMGEKIMATTNEDFIRHTLSPLLKKEIPENLKAIPAADFISFAKEHPIFSSVTDWDIFS
jgi:hypothetical protein